MLSRSTCSGTVVVLLGALLTGSARAQTLNYPPAPVPVDQVVAKMKLPDGFRATLFAAEPDVVQPIAFSFDDRGRMWVAECLSYPKWTKDGTGRDRITIFEDTDGDGVHDKRKVFADNLANLSSLELGFGGVYICSLPALKFIPDRDGDDMPDGPAETLLDGWDENCRHNVFNGLAWGPDGWLYGLNGILSRSSVGPPGAPPEKRKYLDCGVWRYHPTRHEFESVASGTTNPWGLDWDDYGEMFITNCVIKHLFHVVPGGHYERMFGADPNPHVYGLMQSCADHIHWAGGHWTESRGGGGAHSDAGGGHAHSGCCVYLGDNFPPEYRNNVFMCNIHGNRVNRDRLERQGSGYVAHHEPDFLFANDPWHRGLVVKYGPDGALYVADWCDTGECHNYDVADVTNGRIVRVTYEGGKGKAEGGKSEGTKAGGVGPRFDLQKQSDAELFKLQSHENDWFVRHARRILQERANKNKLTPELPTLLGMMFREDPEPTQRLRALWALHAIGRADDVELVAAMNDKSEHVRAWGVTLAGEQREPEPLAWTALTQATKDPALVVRLRAASIAQRLSQEKGLAIASALSHEAANAKDELLPQMIWYALEKTSPQGDAASAIPLVRRNTARHQLLTAGSPEERSARIACLLCDNLLSKGVIVSAPNRISLRLRPGIEDVCGGILEALRGTRDLPADENWKDVYGAMRAHKSAEVNHVAQRLAVIFGDTHVLAQLRETLGDKSQPVEARKTALELLVEKRGKDLPPVLTALLDEPAMRGEALRGLAAYDEAATPAAILARFAQFDDAAKADALQTLAARPKYALALLDAVAVGTIDRRDVPSSTAAQLAALKNKEVAKKLAEVWGAVRPTNEARLQQAARLKQVLSPDAIAKADVAAGRALFTKNCAACHKLFGEGGKIGPELTGSQRANVDYVLENVLDPSAKVGRLYLVTMLELADGRIVQGVVSDENDLAVTIQTPNEQLVIAKKEIDRREQTKLSLMPDGLFDKLTDDEIRALMAYLAK